ncbi:MAG: hypothetical protein Q7J58_06895 [Hydrogenophaga sp.]|nr:hypothetical protein [Hydrogenophaga sp.]MDP3373209.1 hypothetical protein [Hydrogenophaga sp.]
MKRSLLTSFDEVESHASGHGGDLNARGSYNTLDFVVRLRRDVHLALEPFGDNLDFKHVRTFEEVQAFSTYLHETVHWWQHIGTTAGLMLSFLQPAHAHLNRRHLDELLGRFGPVKPLTLLAEQLLDDDKQDGALNAVLNNWHDLEFFRRLALDPVGQVESVAGHAYFHSVGHSYQMAIGATSWLIGATLDPNYQVLPHPKDWESAMDSLREAKEEGFYRGSPIKVPMLGLKHIFEGQARFTQIQYLYCGSGRELRWQDLRELGMLNGVYVHAFNTFLQLVNKEWPETIEDPLVGLFLLICDLSLSPSEGLFLPMTDPSALIWSTDPGWRFMFLCRIAKSKGKEILGSIIDYSADDYWRVSESLSAVLLSPSPRTLAETIVDWSVGHEAWIELAAEAKTFDFQLGNYPIRVLLSRFVQFQKDKLDFPHFFCWPGMCMTTDQRIADPAAVLRLFNEHEALFLNKADDLDVFPRLLKGVDESKLQSLVDDFYAWVTMYEFTRQWLVEAGDFDYDFGWLSSKFSKDDMKNWVDQSFKLSTGILPADFKVIQR